LRVRVQSEAAAAEHDRDPDADLARVFRDRETRTEDGDSEGRVDRGEQHPQPRAIAQQRMGIQADRAYSPSTVSRLTDLRPIRTTRTYVPYVRAVYTGRIYG